MKVSYDISEDGSTTIENYNNAAPFANFFPGVAGLDGVPLWCFFVNRGQCVSSFGVRNKSGAMLDFSPAVDAYRLTPLGGFRTFLKVAGQYYEPFRPGRGPREYGCVSTLSFNPAELNLKEINPRLNVEVNVTFMTVPRELYPALARRVSVTNTGSETVSIEWIDGLPRVLPFGLDHMDIKHMMNTRSGTAVAANLENRAPVFQTRKLSAQGAEGGGHFALHCDEEGLMPPIVDPACVFGPDTGLDLPRAFLDAPFSVPRGQLCEGLLFTAMMAKSVEIPPGETVAIHALYGHVNGRAKLESISASACTPGWFKQKREENRRLISEITNPCAVFSADVTYDNYCRATFLDNVLRGGLPVNLPDASGRKRVFYVYSRIHGDLERDYNHFEVEPCFWSQGNGGYRDIAQNQRNAIYVNPDVLESNIRTYTDMIFLDGYNPHYLFGTVFRLEEGVVPGEAAAEAGAGGEGTAVLTEILKREFTPGGLLTAVAENRIKTAVQPLEFLGRVMAKSFAVHKADTISGFWTDHFHYNLDFIDSFLSLYPDCRKELFFDDRTYRFCRGEAFVRPRSERVVIEDGIPVQKNFLDTNREPWPPLPLPVQGVRIGRGAGEVYETSLFERLFALVPVKMATLDPFGMGIEFEAGKANWNDALHDMSRHFGSSINETIELRRLVDLLTDVLPDAGSAEIRLPGEVADLVDAVSAALRDTAGDDPDSLFEYWDRTNTAKETFRASTRDGIDGEEKTLGANAAAAFLKACREKLDSGIERAIDGKTGLITSYFYHRLVEYETVKKDGRVVVVPGRFEQHGLTDFLEGPMHYLRSSRDEDEARSQYLAVRNSPLYDTELEMYRVSEPLGRVYEQMGAACAWPPGYLENASIWLHMEYKFLLEVLKSGLHSEFWRDMRKALIPFQPPERYGRSVLENSSFLVTSAHPCREWHGRGFYARLSGATAEFHDMWIHANCGNAPFETDGGGRLRFRLRPVLPAWLFARAERKVNWLRDGETRESVLPADHYAFVLFNRTLVVYVNPGKKNTFGEDGVSPARYVLRFEDGGSAEASGCSVDDPLARRIREGDVSEITVYLAADGSVES
ncbi:MAG: hypothetical protein R6V03_01060 [Kiritimatiellia bacterium]